MSRIKLLQPVEIAQFNRPPIFTSEEQELYFSTYSQFEEEFSLLRDTDAKIGFILQLGYFKHSGRFYEVSQFFEKDIQFVFRQLGWKQKLPNFKESYSSQIAYYHRGKILLLLGWSSFEDKQAEFTRRVGLLIDQQLLPRKVLWKVQAYLFENKIEAPAYDTYLKAINAALLESSLKISSLLAQHISKEDKAILDLFITRERKNQKTQITTIRHISQSEELKAIKESLEIYKQLRERLDLLSPLASKLKLSDALIDYHAHWASIADTQKLAAHSDKYLYLLCFLIYQVRARGDIFMDILLTTVKAARKYSERAQEKKYFANRNQRQKATRLLVSSRKDYKTQVEAAKTILKSGNNAEEKIEYMEQLFEIDIDLNIEQEALVAKIENELNEDEEITFNDIWETKAAWLSNRVAEIIRQVPFNPLTTDKNLFAAIEHFKENKSRISAPAKNMSWLSDSQQDSIYEYDKETGKSRFRSKLYKMFLFEAIEKAIKSGEAYPLYSLRYRSLEESLVDKEHREQYLTDADLSTFSDAETVIKSLSTELDVLLNHVNTRILKGENEHFSINKKGKPQINTPAVVKPDTKKLAQYFKPARFVPISTLLSDIQKACPFLHLFGYQGKTQEKFRPTDETFFAALIAQGCNIGVDKMGRIGKGIEEKTLKHTADWYLNSPALEDGSDILIKFKNNLSLPSIHQRELSQIHTVSDGQKILVRTASQNSAISYKYPGFTKASVINTAIDERMSVFKTFVISAAERENINVVDMHLGNPVIKSNTHSTDTHGSSDLVFGMMYFLDIFYAPRLADLQDRILYTIKPIKNYAKLNYPLLPTKYINLELIKEYWDDILRIITSLKLGKITAYQVFKRLNSFAKQNPLERALKEFGRLIQTIFILKYYDDLSLRQAIQKQLGHIELVNRFSKVVYFAGNQEFDVGTKQEQERIILCRRFLQNAIILWNYLYLTELLEKTENKEELKEILEDIRNATIITWQHINMIGEYDFTNLLEDRELRFNMSKLKTWNYQKSLLA